MLEVLTWRVHIRLLFPLPSARALLLVLVVFDRVERSFVVVIVTGRDRYCLTWKDRYRLQQSMKSLSTCNVKCLLRSVFT